MHTQKNVTHLLQKSGLLSLPSNNTPLKEAGEVVKVFGQRKDRPFWNPAQISFT